MRSGVARALRAAASCALPGGAFLRRDRGDALFVTDAPRLRSPEDLREALGRAGFACAVDGDLLRLYPGEAWLARLEAEYPKAPDTLCESLRRFAGLTPDTHSLGLFTLGAKAMDGGEGAEEFERLLRRRAAECLRLNRTQPDANPRGGGLYACALLRFEMKEVTRT